MEESNMPNEVFEIIYKSFGILASFTVVITFISQIIMPNRKRLLSDHKKFTDRKKHLDVLVKLIDNNNRIINVYGKKGIGKSYFLKYFSDLINSKISKKEISKIKYRELKNTKKLIKRTYVLYYEINEYTKESEIINDFALTFSNKFSKSPYKSFKSLIRNLYFYRRIIIVFDNITNECLENAVESIVNNLLPVSKKLVFILGSVDFLTLPKININKTTIELDEFGKEEITEYSNNCGTPLTDDKIDNILDVSNGLPILVDLMISNDSYSIFDKVLDKYIENVFNQIKSENPYLAKVLIIISLLSLVNTNVSLSLLITVFSNEAISRLSIQKLNMLSVIKYNEKDDTIKVHDIIRDYLVYEHAQQEYYNCIEQLVYFFKQNEAYDNCSVFSVLLKQERYIKYKSIIEKCIENALDSENYTYLLALGNHYFKSLTPKDHSMYYLISYGYISALLSVGDYPSAKKFCDEKALSLKVAVNENKSELALQIANLYHLQSNYSLAIDSYNILLKLSNENQKKDYTSECYFKIAHAYRHMGDYEESQNYYLLSIKHTKNVGVIITAYLELSVIYLFNESLLNNDPQFKTLEKLFDTTKLLLEEYNDKSLHLLYLRNYSRYLLSVDNNHQFSEVIYNYLNEALTGYEQLKKRLIYTMNFEFGEYYRWECINDKAIEYYKESLFFSNRNGDKNLQTMSYIGIILSELQCGVCIYTKSKKNQIELLVKCVEISEEHNLKINSILSTTLLKYIKTNILSENEHQFLTKMNMTKFADVLKSRNNKSLNTVQLFMM